MKTILVSINAKYIHTNNAVRLLKANSTFDVTILEFTIKDDISYIVESINAQAADVIGFSLYIWNVELFKKILSLLEKGNSKIVLGGPEVSYSAFEYIKNPKVDYILKGEAEISFNLLLNGIDNQLPLQDILGITYIDNGNIINNPVHEIQDLSIIKSPHYFKDDIQHIPNKIAYIESSRGCPYKCSYCLSSLEKTVRFFNPSIVKETILYLMKHGTKTVKFLDRTFNANKNTFDLFDFIIQNNNHKTVFQFEISGDTLDTSIIEYVNNNAPKGLFRFEIGIQSTNSKTNLLVDRYQDNNKLFNNIKMIQDAGVIDLHLDLIAGLPEESLESFENTFNEVFKLGALELQLGFLKMLKGTKIRIEANKYGYQYQENAPYQIISNDSLSKTDVEEIQLVEEMLDIHHNKGYFNSNMLTYLLSQESPYQWFKSIGEAYLTNNYSFKGYQISDIYERIFLFIQDEHVINSLKIDYLSRSKIKPKIFWDNRITKKEKHAILEHISSISKISTNKLFKHTVTIEYTDSFYTFYYKDYNASIIKTKKKDITFL